MYQCTTYIRHTTCIFLNSSNSRYLNSVFSPQYNPSVPPYADAKFVCRIHKTKQLGSDVNISKYIEKENYDAFIVGSDQVWREDYSPAILHYFLDFLFEGDKRPRIAYAASFGKSEDYISKEKMPVCRQLLHRFDAVSVREYEGLEILERNFNFHRGIKVLDPTLLLSAEDYRKQIKQEDCLSEPHVAAYILDSSEDKDVILSEVSSLLNLPSKTFSGGGGGSRMLTVSQWLAEFEGADFIVTDSFHGCVFSIIFHKPFVVIANQERGLDRFLSLLHDAELEDRLVYSLNDFMVRKEELLHAPDYAEVAQHFGLLRIKSMEFLTNTLKEKQ